jgi:hypothetical protein
MRKSINFVISKTRELYRVLSLVGIILLLPVTVLAAPVIFYTDITSGPNTGGENNNGAYISIFGKNFGTNLSNVKVYIGGGEVARYMYLAPSYGREDVQQLSVQLGANTKTGAIKVSVSGLDSNTDKTLTVRNGNMYYISQSGSDAGSCGSFSSPCRTVNHAVRDLVHPGDLVIIRGGIWDLASGNENLVSGRWIRPTTTGAAGNPITVYGYPSETITVRFSGGTQSPFGTYAAVDYYTIANIKSVDTACNPGGGCSVVAIGDGGTGCVWPQPQIFNSIRIVNWDASGGCASLTDSHFSIGVSVNVKFLGIRVHNSGDGGEAHSHPIYLSAQQTGTEVGWCQIDNIARSRALIQAHTDSHGGTCDQGTGAVQPALTDIYIHDNVIHDVNGQAVLLGGCTGDIYFTNNLIYKSPVVDIVPDYEDVVALRSWGLQNTRFYNNTIYSRGGFFASPSRLVSIGADGNPKLSVDFKNNIFYTTNPNAAYMYEQHSADSTITADYNIFYGSSTVPQAWNGVHSLVVDPKFVNPTVGNFKLQSDSPAKSAGTSISAVSTVVKRDIDGVIRPLNSYDIGAFQYNTNIKLPSPPFLHPIP